MMRGADITELVDAIADALNQYLDDNPETPSEEIVCALDYVRATLFRANSDTPAAKLH